MRLTILTPEKKAFSGDIKSVKVPGTSGQFEILEGHAAIVSSLAEGQIRIIDVEGKKFLFTIEKGFVEVINKEVALLVHGLNQIETDR